MRFIAVLSLLLGAGCSKDAPKPPPIVEHTRALAGEMCACTTRTCADAVAKKWTEPREQAQDLGEVDLENLLAQSKRFEQCLESITKGTR